MIDGVCLAQWPSTQQQRSILADQPRALRQETAKPRYHPHASPTALHQTTTIMFVCSPLPSCSFHSSAWQRLPTAPPPLLLSHSRGVRPDERWESAKNRGGGCEVKHKSVVRIPPQDGVESRPPPAFFPLRRSYLLRRPRPQRDTAKTAAKTYWIPGLFNFDGVALPAWSGLVSSRGPSES
ncbi:hypothetical protein BJX96DRAFT_105496 [Aspergillus floccosus]